MAFASLQCPNCGGKDIDMNHEGTVADPYVCKICGSMLTFQDNAFHIMIDNNPTQSSLLERASIELSSGNYDNAGKCIDQLLNINPKCAEAYMLRMCVDANVNDIKSLGEQPEDFSKSPDYQTALRFANPRQKEEWQELAENAKARIAIAKQKREERERIALQKQNELDKLQTSMNALTDERDSLNQELYECEKEMQARGGIIKEIFTSMLAIGYAMIVFWFILLAVFGVVAFLLKRNYFEVLFIGIPVILIATIIYSVVSSSSRRSRNLSRQNELQSKLQEVERKLSQVEGDMKRIYNRH